MFQKYSVSYFWSGAPRRLIYDDGIGFAWMSTATCDRIVTAARNFG